MSTRHDRPTTPSSKQLLSPYPAVSLQRTPSRVTTDLNRPYDKASSSASMTSLNTNGDQSMNMVMRSSPLSSLRARINYKTYLQEQEQKWSSVKQKSLENGFNPCSSPSAAPLPPQSPFLPASKMLSIDDYWEFAEASCQLPLALMSKACKAYFGMHESRRQQYMTHVLSYLGLRQRSVEKKETLEKRQALLGARRAKRPLSSASTTKLQKSQKRERKQAQQQIRQDQDTLSEFGGNDDDAMHEETELAQDWMEYWAYTEILKIKEAYVGDYETFASMGPLAVREQAVSTSPDVPLSPNAKNIAEVLKVDKGEHVGEEDEIVVDRDDDDDDTITEISVLIV